MQKEAVQFKFVGRDKEFKDLEKDLDQSIEGNGKLIFISGEAGIGKTRLVEELRKIAETKGVNFLTGRCMYRADTDPFLPFIDAFRKYFNIKAEDDGETEKKKISYMIKKSSPELVQMIPIIGNIISAGVSLYVHRKREGEEEEKSDSAEQEKDRMFETISQLLNSISKKEPLVLFLDDLHWADDASLSVLHYIARTLGEQSILILGTYRPEDLDESGKKGLAEILRRMSREDLYTELKLGRLKPEDISKMIKDTYETTAPAEFVDMIYKQTDGNPFFVGEILLSLQDDGIIDISTKKWPENLNVEDIELPSRIEDVIARRINKIEDEEAKVLKCASVIGEVFPFRVLNKIMEIDEEKLAELLEDAISRNLIYELGEEDKYKFNHALIREYLYKGFSGVRLKIMCKKVGLALEELYKDDLDDVVADLAFFFSKAEVPDKALKYSMIAGDIAFKKYAHKESIEHYKNALNLLRGMKDTGETKQKKAETRSRLGKLNYIIADWDKAMKNYKAALELGKELKDDKLLADTYQNIGHIESARGEWAEAVENYNKCLGIAEKINDLHILADTHFGFGTIYFREGKFDDALQSFDKCLEYSGKTNDKVEMQKANLEIAFLYMHRGDMEKAIEYCKKALDGSEYYIAFAYNHIGDVYKESYQYDEALEYYNKSIELAKRSGFIRWVAYGYGDSSEIKAKTGHPDEAMKLIDDAKKIFNKLNEVYMLAAMDLFYGITYRVKKDFDKSAEHFKQSIEGWKEGRHPYYHAQTYYEYALTLKEQGKKAEAKKNIETALSIYKKINAKRKIKEMESELGKLKA